MTDSPTPALAALSRPLKLTLLGLWAERLTRAFWPLWTLVLLVLSTLAFGLQDVLPIEAVWTGMVLAVLGIGITAWRGTRAFRRPTTADALARLDSRLPGQPIAALSDIQAIGTADPASLAVWNAHKARMAARAAQARAVEPDLRLASRDPFALRYVALTALVMALMFGSIWRVASVAALTPGAGEAVATGPTWEGWAQPPAYTGKPSLYLNEITAARLDLPAGTRLQFRLYGEVGSLTLSETVSGRTEVPPASDPVHDFTLQQAGTVRIEGDGGREWQITVLPDAPPEVIPSDRLEREANGQLKQEFTARDDYGVVAGQVTIALDLPAVDRRFGLATDPEPRDPVVLDLPMPMSGNRSDFAEVLVDDLSQHPFANLPVTMTFTVADAVSRMRERLPPTSRWIASAETVQRRSSLSTRSATRMRALSTVAPICTSPRARRIWRLSSVDPSPAAASSAWPKDRPARSPLASTCRKAGRSASNERKRRRARRRRKARPPDGVAIAARTTATSGDPVRASSRSASRAPTPMRIVSQRLGETASPARSSRPAVLARRDGIGSAVGASSVRAWGSRLGRA